MVFEYVVYGLIQDQTKRYLRRLVCRIKGAPSRNGIEQLIDNVENLFETWFLVDRTHLTQHALSENECGNRNNSIMIGKRIDISFKKNNWVILRIDSKTETWNPFIMQVPVDLRTQKRYAKLFNRHLFKSEGYQNWRAQISLSSSTERTYTAVTIIQQKKA